MDFQITESELNRLTDIAGHIGLILDLACHITGPNQVPVAPENLRCFLATSYDGLSEVLETVLDRQRHTAQAETPNATRTTATARKRDQLTAGAA